MKKILLNAFAVAFLLSMSSISFSQSWKSIANKAKEKAPVPAITESQTNTSSQDSNDGNTQNAEDNANAPAGIEDFIQQKYSLIKSREPNLTIYTLERDECDPERHNKGAKALDYAATVSKIKSEGKLLASDHRYKLVMEYGSEYLNVFKNALKPYVNKTIENAYSIKKSNANSAIETARKAQLVAEAAALILYDNADAKQLKEDADKAFNAIGGEYYSKLYVSDMHKNNVGKILFSKTPIIPGKEDPNQFVTTVSGTDKVYAIAYFNAKLKDKDNMIRYNIQIDGNDNNTPDFNANQSDMEHSYYLIEIIPDPNIAIHQFDAVQFAEVLSSLSPRNHEMKFEFTFGYDQPSATGTLKLDWANVDGAAIQANSQTALKNAKDNKARNMKLPEDFAKPSKAFGDPDLTIEKIKAAIMGNADYSENIKQINKVIIGDKIFESGNDWWISKNDLDIPTHKECNRYIYVLFTGKDGWCYFSDPITFRKDYAGAGTYEATRLVGFSSAFYTRIACENTK